MKTIVCHSFPAWDAPYVKSTVELMKRLTRDHRVIFIDYHFTWKDVFTCKHAPWKRLIGFKRRWRKLNTRYGEIEVYNTPPVLPVNWIRSPWLFRFASGINGWLLKGTFKRIRRRLSKEDTVILNALNPVYGMLSQPVWKGFKTVYYCYDELKGTDWSSKWGVPYESKYLQQVDQVIVTSPRLLETKGKLHPSCVAVKNGVDLDIFSTPLLHKTKNKIIGYVGAVDERIDIDLVCSVARSMPDNRFIFAGPVKSPGLTKACSALANIEFTGSVPQTELPALVSTMDACIIPFVKNEFTAAIYPLKINEYLAMGKPVVSTGFSDLSDFDSIISLADKPEAFVEALQRELKGNTRYRIQKRIKFARQNSWEARAKTLAQSLT